MAKLSFGIIQHQSNGAALSIEILTVTAEERVANFKKELTDLIQKYNAENKPKETKEFCPQCGKQMRYLYGAYCHGIAEDWRCDPCDKNFDMFEERRKKQ